MTYKPVTLASLVALKNRDLFLPHIQRPFVWEWDQVTKFLDSLMKGYPIQTFLTWKTRDPIKARRFMDDVVEDPELSDYYDKEKSQQGIEKIFVLDGQQRLQSLFSAFAGTFYGEDLYIDITTGDTEIEDGMSYNFKRSSASLQLPWFRLKQLSVDGRNSEDISDEINDRLATLLPLPSPEERTKRERRVRRNMGQLTSILREDKHIWIEELDGISSNRYPYDVVLNIFVRVNSGGTKLGAADLLFAAMKEAWADAEQDIEQVVDNLNASGKVEFEKDMILRALNLAAGLGATISPELYTGSKGDANLKTLEANWERANKAFDQLRDFIYNDLKIYSNKVIRSYNAFIPMFEYFYLNPSPTPEDKQLLKSYYYKSQLFNWYAARTNETLESIHHILAKNSSGKFPLAEIKALLASQGRLTDLTIDNLQDARLRYIVLNLIYVEQNSSSPFDVQYKGNEPHIDHIYPKSKLKTYSTQNVNHIGNYRFLGATDNIKKRAEDPGAYFTRMKSSGIPIMRHLLVKAYSDDPGLLTYHNYTDFRDKRLQEIFTICSSVVNK